MVYAIGDAFEGSWRGDVPDGQGVINFVTGGKYSGRMANGQRHGRGTYRFANGDVYDGEHSHDMREGRGTYTVAANGGSWTQLSYYRGDVQVGEGVEWSNEKKAAWALRDGRRVEEIDLKKALSLVAHMPTVCNASTIPLRLIIICLSTAMNWLLTPSAHPLALRGFVLDRSCSV